MGYCTPELSTSELFIASLLFTALSAITANAPAELCCGRATKHLGIIMFCIVYGRESRAQPRSIRLASSAEGNNIAKKIMVVYIYAARLASSGDSSAITSQR